MGPLPPGTIEADIQQWNVDLAVAYGAIPNNAKEQPWQLDLIVGGWYVDLKQQVILPSQRILGGSQQWVEVFFGARVTCWISEGWSLILRGDVGGFGWGSDSSLTCKVFLGADCRFGERRNWHHGMAIAFSF